MGWEPWTGCYKISDGCTYCWYYGPYSKRCGQNTVVKTEDFYKPLETVYMPRKKITKYKMESGKSIAVCFTTDFFLPEADEWRGEAWSEELYNKFLDFMRQMDKTEKTEDTFGLTHGDYLVSNYLIDDNNNLTVIDFDECEYSWFAADLAICMRAYLFWTENPALLPQKANEAEMMHYNLLLGYSSENKVTENMVYDLGKYIKIRDYIELASQFSFEPETFNDYPIEKILFEMNLDRIVNDKPFLEFNTARAEKLLT